MRQTTWACILLLGASTASAQDSSFAELRLRGSVFRNPVSGHIADDWRPKTGVQIEAASNVGRSELALAIGHIGYEATTGKPPFTGTLFSLGWSVPVKRWNRLALDLGARLTDLRMDFDDPSLVGGLRTEEEVVLSGLARGRVSLGRRFSVYADVSYGVLMLSTKTPMLLVSAGVERSVTTPGWLRGLLR
jgi:hypothetical protein